MRGIPRFGRIRRVVVALAATTAVATAVAASGAALAPAADASPGYTVPHIALRGLGIFGNDGAYVVSPGSDYRLVVVSNARPRYVDAAIAPGRPHVLGPAFYRDGTYRGVPRWKLRVHMDVRMSARTHWNIGVRIGGELHVVRLIVMPLAGSGAGGVHHS